MSNLKNKVASLSKVAKIKKKAEYVDVNVTGFRGYKGEQLIFFIDCNDSKMKEKIMSNSLSESERNFIVATVGEYFDETCRTNEDLFKVGIEDLIIMYEEGQMDLPQNLINEEFLKKCSRKKQGTGEMAFNKTKFRGMPLADKVQVVNDPMEFFMDIWGEDYLDGKSDINNLVKLNDSDISDLEDDETQTAILTSPVRRRFIKAKEVKKK